LFAESYLFLSYYILMVIANSVVPAAAADVVNHTQLLAPIVAFANVAVPTPAVDVVVLSAVNTDVGVPESRAEANLILYVTLGDVPLTTSLIAAIVIEPVFQKNVTSSVAVGYANVIE